MPTAPEATGAEKLPIIANYFALGQIHVFERAAGTNENYLVTTTRGEYFFKIIRNIPYEELLKSLSFLQRLQEQHFSATAYYLLSPAGTMVYHGSDCVAVVLQKLPGTMPQLTPAVSREVGRALAQLHLIPCNDLPEKRHWLDNHYLPEALQAAITRYGPERLPETLAVFRSLAHFKPATFPQSIVHSDLDASNCLFEGEQLVAFIDWEEIGVGAALLDFAMTILGFCFIEPPTDSAYWAIFDPELYRALFEGYTSVRPFSEYELQHLDAALKYAGLTQPVWSMLKWELYHPDEEMRETHLLYWKYGLHELTLPKF